MGRFCGDCGRELPEGALFCTGCGAQVGLVNEQQGGGERWRQHATDGENAAVSGQRVTPNVYLGADGKYRWVYELKVAVNPSARRYTLKVFAYILLAMTAPLLLFGLFTGSEGAMMSCLIMGGIGGFIYVVTLLAFGILALVYRGSYWSIFEMDASKIVQTQMHQTADRSKVLSVLLMMGARDLGEAAIAGSVGANTRYETPFCKIRGVRLDRRHDLIDCKRRFGICPVYAPQEDYDFIAGYIKDHLPERGAAGGRKAG